MFKSPGAPWHLNDFHRRARYCSWHGSNAYPMFVWLMISIFRWFDFRMTGPLSVKEQHGLLSLCEKLGTKLCMLRHIFFWRNQCGKRVLLPSNTENLRFYVRQVICEGCANPSSDIKTKCFTWESGRTVTLVISRRQFLTAREPGIGDETQIITHWS